MTHRDDGDPGARSPATSALSAPVGRDAALGRDSQGRFALGNPGRPFGTRNRVSARVARAILADFEANQDDTLGRLRRWFLPQYVAMISRLLPRDGEGEGGVAAPPDAPTLADLRGLIDQLEANGGDGADLQALLFGVGLGGEADGDGAGTDIIGR